ncbi:MAG: Gfo/Idh/MocA family oxidoreductase [Clostridia bacterium]|nr:Gfo/Idh/MocA family oxidoreductase [Clostridia bacterium]
MLKYATIGTSFITEQFVTGANATGRVTLAAVYSRKLETGTVFAQKFGCDKVYTSLQALAEDSEIDAVYVASPNVFHAEQSEILLKAGKHIICEKPITTSAAEYGRLKALADKNGLIYIEAIIPIYNPSRNRIKKAIGKIGNIAMAKIDYCQRSSRYDRFMQGENVNIFDMSLHAGTVMDLGVYCVYAAVDLFGMPSGIEATANFLSNGADGSGAAIFKYDNFSASLTYSKTGQSVAPTEIVGDSGSVIMEKAVYYQDAYLVKGGEKTSLFDDVSKETLMGYEATAFCDFIEGKRLDEYINNSEIGLLVHRCMDVIKQRANIIYK